MFSFEGNTIFFKFLLPVGAHIGSGPHPTPVHCAPPQGSRARRELGALGWAQTGAEQKVERTDGEGSELSKYKEEKLRLSGRS